MRQWLKFQLMKMILLINNENFSNINFSKLGSPINRIASVCFMVFTDIITYLLPNITFLVIICIYFLYKNTVFGTGFIVGNVLLFMYLYANWQEMIDSNENYEHFVNDNESYITEILGNMDKIIYRGQTKYEIGVFDEKCKNTIRSAFDFYSTVNNHGIVFNVILLFILIASIAYLIRLYFDKKITLTVFISFFTILLLYRDKMITLVQQVPDFIEFIGRTDSVLKNFANMENNYNLVLSRQYVDVKLAFETIRFENVNYKYDETDSHNVLDDCNLRVETNNHKIIGITGLSGNGKSTFAKLILKMYSPTAGKIYIDEQDIENVDCDYIRENITYVNQNTKLFDTKVIDNILYGCSDIDECQFYLQNILKYGKIRELFRNTNIYEKNAGSMGNNLSGGQRMVANVIGGLINPSKILVLDEPTNGLDHELKQELIGLIRDFAKYKNCIIVITHDKDCYQLFDENIEF
jgi:ABC-type bacteriocin/lantibiotic exporter with double-glycine peptidase domain